MALIFDFSWAADLGSKARHVVIQIPGIIDLENDIAQTSQAQVVARARKRADTKPVAQEKSLVEWSSRGD